MSYTGQHSYNAQDTVNLNNIDLGTAYLPQYQDPTQAPNGVTTSLVNTNVNQVRFYPGYGNINQNQPSGRRTYHSIQVAWNRRLKDGISFGFNDTISLYDKQQIAPRLAAQRGRHASRSGPIRRRPTSCSATTTRRRTSCAPTSSGSCRTSRAARPAR